MSILAEIPFVVHIATGGSSFAFDFLVLAAADLEVYVDGSQTTGFSATGLNDPAGGTVILNTAPASGLPVVLRRAMPETQDTDLITGGLIAAETMEDTLDRLVMLVQDLREILSRVPALAPFSGSALRHLLFPAPVALGLLGWNAQKTALTTHPATIQQVTVSATSQKVSIQGVVEVSASSGAGTAQLTASAFLPSGSMIESVVGYVKTTCGNSQGLTTFDIGDANNLRRWGTAIPRTAASQSNVGQHIAYAPQPQPAASDVWLTANDGGLWDATGVVVLTYVGYTVTPKQSV